MRYLLDTCAWIYLLTNDDKLTEQQKEAMLNPEHTIYLSVVSAWEMSIKISKGKLKLPKSLDELIFESCIKDGYIVLDLDIFSVLNTKALPNHHRDPFDRMLISQAINNDLTIVTTDSKFSDYEVKLV
ncbi:MAG: type II toxin-antitoxin system VapC family toxin [Xenococcus sp. MO_188.B8]|nr:type II toxin-antitoxin system VapC family toxin [Xenococcus sp. MO_188.B8]